VAIVDAVCVAMRDRGVEKLTLNSVVFLNPLAVEEEGREFEIVLTEGGSSTQFECRSRQDPAESWGMHARGEVSTEVTSPGAALQEVSCAGIGQHDLPFSLIDFGPHWGCVEHEHCDGDTVRMRLKLPEELDDDFGDYVLHPSLLDLATGRSSGFYEKHSLPFAYDSIRIYGSLTRELRLECRRHELGDANVFDIDVESLSGERLVEVEGFSRRSYKPSESLGEADASTARAQRLEIIEPGDLGSLKVVDDEVPPPGPGEVHIQVVAAGLNFRDVLSALGSLAGQADVRRLGGECSGCIVAVGSGVQDFQVGESVVALARGGLATDINVDQRLVAPMPTDMSFEDGAGVPLAHMTAAWALHFLARIREGERILIHAATGGVGLATVALAQEAGAEIFATAGSPEKREYLKELGIGAVMDSRSTDFVETIRERTNGEGVDIVLNSLAGEFIAAGISVLRPFGRFIEIGKRDLYSGTAMDLYPFHKNLTYSAFDLGAVMVERPDELQPMFLKLMQRFESGELAPSPTKSFLISEASKGFEHVARTEHIGKVVFRVAEDRSVGPDGGWKMSAGDQFDRIFRVGFSVRDGLSVFRRLLSSDDTPPHVLILDHKPVEISMASAENTAIAAGRRPRPDIATKYAEAQNSDEHRLVDIWERILGIAPVGVNDDFFELGGNSITAIQTLYEIGRSFDAKLPMSLLFANATVAKLAANVDKIKTAGSQTVEAILEEVEAMSEGAAANERSSLEETKDE